VRCGQFTNGAGEDIRYVTGDEAENAGLPNHDYWLFDSRKLVRMHFDHGDCFLGGEVIEDLAVIVAHNYWRDAACGTVLLDGTTLSPNRTSGASNVHEARNALGKRLPRASPTSRPERQAARGVVDLAAIENLEA
jgi:hypothetical protein